MRRGRPSDCVMLMHFYYGMLSGSAKLNGHGIEFDAYLYTLCEKNFWAGPGA